LTHLLAQAREIPISAATWAIGRSAHRAARPRRSSTDNGGITVGHGRFLRLSGRGVWRFLILPPKNPSPRHLSPCRRLQRHDPQQLITTHSPASATVRCGPGGSRSAISRARAAPCDTLRLCHL
jgi:hypothetical protein